MALPKRKYYSLDKASKELGCDIDDLLHYATIGILQLSVYVEITESNSFSECYIDSDADDELLEYLQKETNPKSLIRSTEMNYISEDASFFLLSKADECESKINGAAGWFALNHTELATPKFEKDGEIEVFSLGNLREHFNFNSEDTWGSTPGYRPGPINFYAPKKFTTEDFHITCPELELLKSGGEDLFKSAFANNPKRPVLLPKITGAKTVNSQAEFIKALLYVMYSDRDLIESPRKYIDDSNSDISKDFDAKGLKLPTGKTIATWLKNADLPLKIDGNIP